ncbi:thiamine/thiamine pyrophosphate ABC transporter permease ThiP [Vibrio sp. dsl-7]|uniref:Thiamine transport system permease protein ThiP n=1 Tax=Vibrio chanodichtyis TaxID=3027932 RepID=A0ABT5V167_9VIBR|nr:thiamine/thiamine pyrophosphate ABC transporter permease ThiP [Vibrio chanodichtyis]MDE1515071.1 thiamine/thiamine pyrophosphate ABC transporter permease ThiP [Vibrio chanodichtyis]
MNHIPQLGWWVAAGIATFVCAALAALLWQAPSLNLQLIWQDAYYWHVTKFSFYQALCSTVISVGLAIPVAHAFSQRRFPGRDLLLKLFAMTLVLPVLVVILGLLAIYGNSGWLAQSLHRFGLSLPFSIYGLNGILLAHVLFNLPYASRLLLQSLEAIPSEQHKLCAHLGMSRWQKFKLIEWLRMRQQLPHVAGLVFMLCFTSFTTVMALGGGPQATTIELAIYQAIKFDFDLHIGALLAIWQMLLCTLFTLGVQRLAPARPFSRVSSQVAHRWLRDSWRAKLWDAGWIIAISALVLPPLLMVLLAGINAKLASVLISSAFWSALLNSVQVASLASSLALASGIAMLLTSRALRLKAAHRRAGGIEWVASLILVTPGLVVSTGLFLLLRNITDVFSVAFWIVVAVNGLMALPYVVKTLSQPMWHLAQQYQWLCASLGLSGWRRFRLVEWRALRKPISHAFAIGFLLSMGDLSAIALFGSQDFRTLPLYLYQLLGSYQMDTAAVVALAMLLISVGWFYLLERLLTQRQRGESC